MQIFCAFKKIKYIYIFQTPFLIAAIHTDSVISVETFSAFLFIYFWINLVYSLSNSAPNPFCPQNMADSLLDGEMTLDSFIDAYQNKRKLAHLRRVKIEKLQEMVMKGQRLPQLSVPPSRSQEISGAASLLSEAGSSSSSPLAQPRRKPPPPPSQPAPILSPPPTAEPQPPFSYPASQYPPIPPRTGQPFPNIPSGYPNSYLSQYPPALPQRAPPRMAPQPGFIMQ